MTDVLLTLLVLCLIFAAACLIGLLLFVVPFVLTVDQAERRGLPAFRWGIVALSGEVLMLVLAYLVLKDNGPKLLLLLALLLPWVGLAVGSRLGSQRGRLGGLAGAHQR